jgi:hypothetical protein
LCDWLSALPPWIGPEDLGGGWILLDAEGCVVRRVRAGLHGKTGW